MTSAASFHTLSETRFRGARKDNRCPRSRCQAVHHSRRSKDCGPSPSYRFTNTQARDELLFQEAGDGSMTAFHRKTACLNPCLNASLISGTQRSRQTPATTRTKHHKVHLHPTVSSSAHVFSHVRVALFLCGLSAGGS